MVMMDVTQFFLVMLMAWSSLVLAQHHNTAPGVNPHHYQQTPQQAQQMSMQQVPHPQQVPMQQVPHQQQVPMQQVPHQQQVPMQQVPHQQQVPMQQVPMQQVPHQQQVPMQQVPHQQHVPMQQVSHQQQVPMQQVPHPQQVPQHVPVQHMQAPHPQGQAILHDKQQIAKEKDHIKEHMHAAVDTSAMSEQELQFHYFKMHDADNNNKLDGCELVKSLIHWHDQANHDPHSGMPIPEPKIFTDMELSNMIDPILESDDKNGDGFIDYPEFIQAQAQQAAAGVSRG